MDYLTQPKIRIGPQALFVTFTMIWARNVTCSFIECEPFLLSNAIFFGLLVGVGLIRIQLVSEPKCSTIT